MSREILFKAKYVDTGEWVEGSLVHYKAGKKHFIITDNDFQWGMYGSYSYDGDFTEIDETTICQYTGLTDKNGNKIWENDVLKIARTSDSIGEYYYPPLDYPANVVVKWDLCAWMWETIEKRKHYISFPDAWCHYEAEVIGNIFDNSELLKGE